MKKCKACNRKLPRTQFCNNKMMSDGLHSYCRKCMSSYGRQDREKNPLKYLLKKARYRAQLHGLPFNLDEDNIGIPDVCPILGVPMAIGSRRDYANSPSVDKINPKGGYTTDNCQIISTKANMMKSNATQEELVKFAQWVMRTYGKETLDKNCGTRLRDKPSS